jgi:hypothetical protein
VTLQRVRRRRKRRTVDVKDRLIQTRVPERLETVLKEEAQKRRLTVSHLIRNMLEDTFELVDNVVAGAGDIAKDSAAIAGQVAADAGKIAATVRGAAEDASKLVSSVKDAVRSRGAAPSRRRAASVELGHVLAWNQVVVNQPVECVRCDTRINRGGAAHLGLSRDPAAAPTWLCPDCLTRL